MDFEAHHIRQYVDGELSPQDTSALEESMKTDQDLAARIDFDRSLQAAVKRHASRSAPAPAELKSRVRAAIASYDESQEQIADTPREEAAAVEAISTSPNARPRMFSLFQNPVRINYFALAACLAIVTGAVLFGIFGDTLLQPRQESPAYSIAMVAEMAVNEHNRCVFDPTAQMDKIRIRDPKSITALMTSRLGKATPLFDLLSVGYELVGAGECMLPPTSDGTVHIMYRRTSGLLGQVSVFIQPDEGQFDTLETGQVYRPRDFQSCLETGSTCVFRHNGLVYFLIACDSEDHPRVQALVTAQLEAAGSSN